MTWESRGRGRRRGDPSRGPAAEGTLRRGGNGRCPRPRSPSFLPDVLAPGLDALLVGINPGLRSAALGHHFAGRSNRFWSLLHQADLTQRRLSFTEDRTLPQVSGLGLTNLAARPTRSSADLAPRDFSAGRRALLEKVEHFRPGCVAFVGLTAYREFFRGLPEAALAGPGPREAKIEGAAVYVLPNPSGRNAHFPGAAMAGPWREFGRWLAARRKPGRPSGEAPCRGR